MKSGVLLVNTGTPDTASVPDVSRYLRQFLNDPFVIDVPWLWRKILVNLLIVPFRAANSARLYREIWTRQGSPLLSISRRQQQLLQEKLGSSVPVALAMRYGSPGIAAGLEEMRKAGVDELLLVPVFPQYASASTGSVEAEVKRLMRRHHHAFQLRSLRSFCDHPAFIRAWQERTLPFQSGGYDHVLFSFHGLPERQILKTDKHGCCLQSRDCCDTFSEQKRDCYRAQCFQTARLIAAALALEPSRYSVSFQSRLGRTPWIKPYTDEVIPELARAGHKSLLVLAPAFVADCLETIQEVGSEYRQLFQAHGGEKFQLVESLNEHPAWINALEKLVRENLSGVPAKKP